LKVRREIVNQDEKQTIIGEPLPNIPWQDKPSGCQDVVWRYSENPIIKRDAIPSSNSIFNSAVVPFHGKFAGVFRCDSKSRRMQLHAGFSEDGINWDIEDDMITFKCDDPEVGEFDQGYDPRVGWIDDRYIVTWCNVYHGYTIGVAVTTDFKTYHQRENAFVPFNRNGVLFPKKIRNKYIMLNRPSDTGHTPFGDIFYSESPDLIHWGCHRHVMSPSSGWQSTKIGAGPVPIETTEGWLLIYHGVLTSCNGFVYSMGAALLDLDEPWKVMYRTTPYLMSPQTLYECVGDVPNVVFPCAALTDPPSGKITIYYGAADTVLGLAFAQVDELIDFIKQNSEPW
jgi:beta-1,4-mannooligosaccharide/beta-1,4-mannosyl-N-acetylglucosamine phosphorylase